MTEQRKGSPLSEVFRKAMARHDNNMPVAFIAVLDEIDRRDALIEADMIENAGLFNVMANELGTVGEKQDRLPMQLPCRRSGVRATREPRKASPLSQGPEKRLSGPLTRMSPIERD